MFVEAVCQLLSFSVWHLRLRNLWLLAIVILRFDVTVVLLQTYDRVRASVRRLVSVRTLVLHDWRRLAPHK